VIAPEEYKIRVAQDFVRLLIEGPVFLFRDNEYRKSMSASLVLGGSLAAGSFDLEYDVVLPEGCRLEKKNPETIHTTLKKK